ncbi:MAG: hypothetical protein KDA41_05400 [Planctomycetales bacterium]|nr:hypothetical protein [Planctomycetales bacterium]
MHAPKLFPLSVAVARSAAIWSTLGLLLAGVAGCGPSGPQRFELSGSVTFQGRPVPAGVVFLDPDTVAGNRGLQGYAEIHDGRYDTRVGSGKGHTGGAYRLRVRGFDDSVAKPTPLFDEWETPRDLPDAASTSDIEVTAESAPAGDDPATPFSPT